MFSTTPYTPNGNLIVIDVNNLAHRNWHALSQHKERPVTYGMLRDIGTLSNLFGAKQFVFCFDGEIESNPRRLLHSGYKANRMWNEDKENIKIEISDFYYRVLPSLGYKGLYYNTACEADDLIALIVQRHATHRQCYIISSDTDLFQMVGDYASIWNPIKKHVIDSNWIKKKYDIRPVQWVEYKALIGDKSDNISGVPGIGVVTARWILTGQPVTANIKKKLEDFTDLIERNKQLMKLPFPGMTLPEPEGFSLENNTGPSLDTWKSVCVDLDMDKLCGSYPNG